MSRITPADAVEALKDWGVDFQPWGDNWSQQTTAGGWDPIGITHHHTGGSGVLAHDHGSLGSSQRSMLNLLRVGRSDLDGPLCHLAPTFLGAGKKARVFGIGWGNCNHAGYIDNDVARALRAGSYSGGLRGGSETTDGNSILYGFEYLHPGDSTPWPDELLEAGHRASAAISEAHGWAPAHWAGSNAEHRELTTRKVDRSWTGWGDGMRRQIKLLAEQGKDPAPWGRSAAIERALEELRSAATAKARRGARRQAAALREFVSEISDKFPKERG